MESIPLNDSKNKLDIISIREWIDSLNLINLNNYFYKEVKNTDDIKISVYKFYNTYFYSLEEKRDTFWKLIYFGNLNKYVPNINKEKIMFYWIIKNLLTSCIYIKNLFY